MTLSEKDIEKLDWKSEHGATLETHELLEVLAKIAEDPDAYTWAEFDAGYTRAEQLANALRGMMGGLRAAEIARTFKRAVKARAACEKYNLVPRAKLEHAQEQLRAAGAMNIKLGNICAELRQRGYFPVTIDDVSDAWRRCVGVPHGEIPSANQIAKRLNEVLAARAGLSDVPSIGPGDPEPPPPPPTKAIAAADILNAWQQCKRRVGMFISDELAAEFAARLNDALGIKAS